MIRIAVTGAHMEPGPIESLTELLVCLGADMSILVGDRVLYEEGGFPVLELAGALKWWLRDGAPSGEDFEFDSMSFPEPGVIWIRRVGSGWRLGSIYQEYPEMTVWSLEEIETVANDLVERAAALVPDQYRDVLGQYLTEN